MKLKSLFLWGLVLMLLFTIVHTLYKKRDHFQNNYKYTLSLLVICKNEGMVIDEFVQHYKWQGVEHIYLIDNGSTDNLKEVLAPYIAEGYLSYFNLPEQHKQVDHYNTVYKSHIRNETRWLIVCDADEYIYNKTPGGTITSALRKLTDETCAVLVPWKLFGSSGYKEQPENIRKSFIWRSDGETMNVKSIVNTKNTRTLDIHTHLCEEKKRQIYLDELALNHYAIMSEEYFRKVKMTRGDASSPAGHLQTIRNMDYFEKYDHKDVRDEELKDLLS
jgi:glycosyltransferase involved in cell wall biosynthesis